LSAVPRAPGDGRATVDTGGGRAPRPPEVRSYYQRPVIKEPAWTWEVPWYLFAGGLAGSASVLSLGARLAGQDELADRVRLIAAGGVLVCPPLLISDLGRPSRFYNMLRVFKPTSVMSMGSWALGAYATAAGGAAGLALLGRLPTLRFAADAAAAALGSVMVTYTGALLADTSIPVWHEARRELPLLFAGSGLASAGSAAVLLSPPAIAEPARRLATTGAGAELVVDGIMRRRLGMVGEVYEREEAGRFHRVAAVSTTIGGVAMALGRRRPLLARAGAVALLLGSICQRWSVFRAGFQSARDPQATLGPQRARLERGQGHREAPRSP
jgi:hypothetical protein